MRKPDELRLFAEIKRGTSAIWAAAQQRMNEKRLLDILGKWAREGIWHYSIDDCFDRGQLTDEAPEVLLP